MIYRCQKMKKTIFAVLMFFCVICCAFSEEAFFANRNTALRYLKLAQDYVLKSQWDSVLSSAEIGLTYDSSLADLWYVKSIAESQTQEKPYIIIENLEKSLDREWVSYNPRGAKILLANYYYATMEYEKALSLLDDKTLLLNSDALKTSAKIFYITGNIQKARETIDTAWRMFPLDSDYPNIFYKFENPLALTKEPVSASDEMFFELNETFLSLGFDYLDGKNQVNPKFLLLASSFADDDLQTKMLKVYKTQGIESPLYPIKALEASLMSEDEAISSYFSLSGSNLQFNLLQNLFDLISDEKKLVVYSILDSFEGKLYFDNNFDDFYELCADYKNGRPIFASFEEKQNGIINWTCSFDYGTPRKLFIPNEDLTLTYARYPYISKVETGKLDYNLIPDSCKWLPFEVVSANFSGNNYDFFILNPIENQFDSSVVDANSYAVTTYLTNKNQIGEEKIRFSLSDGKIVTGNYYLDNYVYASAFFEDGQLVSRNVDKDLNGTYEVTEFYATDFPENVELFEKIAYEEIFGNYLYENDVWLQGVFVDTNDDGDFDYSEKYEFDGSIKKKWDIVEERRDANKNLISLIFDFPLSEKQIQVNFVDGKPENFFYNNLVYPLQYDKENDFYWLGNIPTYAENQDYDKIKQDLIDNETAYSVEIYRIDDKNYFYAAKTFDFFFAQEM